MDQPAGSYNESDLARILMRDFKKELVPVANTLLEKYGTESWHPEVLRVRMACLKCANGDIKELECVVEASCSDYRDILSNAEYPTYDKAKNPDDKKRAIKNDWDQLQSWLNRQ